MKRGLTGSVAYLCLPVYLSTGSHPIRGALLPKLTREIEFPNLRFRGAHRRYI